MRLLVCLMALAGALMIYGLVLSEVASACHSQQDPDLLVAGTTLT